MVEPELDAQGRCLEVGVGQWLESSLDPALHFGCVHQQSGERQPAVSVERVGLDERFKVVGDVGPPDGEVREAPGEQVVMRE